MSSAKRLGLGLLAALFTFCIVTVAVLTSVHAVFGTPVTLKKLLVESKVYDGVALGIADQAAKNANQNPTNDLQLDNGVVQGVIRKVVTPQKLQGYAEQIVDGTYSWLEGKSTEPDYRIDLGPLKQDLGISLGDAAVKRVKKLPVCTAQQLSQLDPQDADPFDLPCQPPGINLKSERQKLIKQVTQSQNVLEDTALTADDATSEDGDTPFQKLAFAPTLFQWSQTLPWILGITGLAAAAGIVFMHTNRRTGLKAVAKPLFATGVLLLIGIGITTFLLSRLRIDSPATDSRYLQDATLSLIRSLSSALNRVLLIFALVYTALGAGGLLTLHFTKPSAGAGKGKPTPSPLSRKMSS